MNAISLFSSAGIGEFYLRDLGINIVLANEIVKSRAETHKVLYPSCEVVNGDIVEEKIRDQIVEKCKDKNIELVIVTPPCQGVSTVGKNKASDAIFSDPRNLLVLSALKVIDRLDPTFFIIENVPRFRQMRFPYREALLSLE